MANKRRELLLLPLLALIGGLLVTAVYIVTAPHIADNRQRAADAILLDALALPAASTTLKANGETQDSELLALREPRQIYLARQNNRLVAIILPLTARDGYNGPIDLIAGITPDGKIINVRAIGHRETAGLGDRIDIDKSAWINQFVGKSLTTPASEQWSLKNAGGTFDQITGATVTSRAVIEAVHNALQYFAQHRAQLLEEAQ
ncbi:MAG TPA: RnfABCDGE type electron transport complex subunit G [Spongiibacteraceae bacterium]|nr:RnfABCDGE type electron transport complex subunit G [Spongiibacteraceae bacterium]